MKIVGLDLGRVQDPTAAAVVEVTGRRFHVEHLDVWTPAEEDFADVPDRLPLEADLLLYDGAGIGKHFAPVLLAHAVARRYPVLGIAATHGWRPARQKKDGDRVVFVPKKEIVADLWGAVSERRLTCSRELDLAGRFRRELLAYRETQGPDGLPRWGAAPGEHDDLVAAVSLAVWAGERLAEDRFDFVPINGIPIRKEHPCDFPSGLWP